MTSMLCVSAVETAESVNLKNDPLLTLLKEVYVESKDPAAAAEVRLGHGACLCVLMALMMDGGLLISFEINHIIWLLDF